MKNLNLNLLYQPPKKNLTIGLGISLLLLALITLWLLPEPHWWNIVSIINFLPLGSYLIIQGLGYNPGSFFGKAYIHINPEKIDYKPGVLKKSMLINWSDVAKVQIRVASIQFLLNDESNVIFEYHHLEYDQIQQLKSYLLSFCKEKDIPFNKP